MHKQHGYDIVQNFQVHTAIQYIVNFTRYGCNIQYMGIFTRSIGFIHDICIKIFNSRIWLIRILITNWCIKLKVMSSGHCVYIRNVTHLAKSTAEHQLLHSFIGDIYQENVQQNIIVAYVKKECAIYNKLGLYNVWAWSTAAFDLLIFITINICQKNI